MKLCLGTVQFGVDYGIQGNGRPQEEKVFEMITYAIYNGIDMFDTASAYGEAETVLGDYMRTYPEKAGRIRIVSKLKPNAFNMLETDSWIGEAVRNAEDSLNRLGIKKLYAYLFHNASYIFNEQAVTALDEVRKAGMAEHIGVSIYTPEEAMKALDYKQIDVIQIPYNLFDHRLDKCGFFERAKAGGIIVFARSSLLQGLVMMDPDNLPKRVAFAKEKLSVMRNICSHHNLSVLEAATGYVAGKDGISYTVFGVDSIEQLKEYTKMNGHHISRQVAGEFEQAFSDVEERLVNPVMWK